MKRKRKRKPKTVFDSIRIYGDCNEFEPRLQDVEPCESLPGTAEKIQRMRERVGRGEGIWHEGDRLVYDDGED